MKQTVRKFTKRAVVAKRFEVRLNEDAVNAYKEALRQKQQQQQLELQSSHHRHETRTKKTSITVVGGNNRPTTMNTGSRTITHVKRAQASKTVVARKSNGANTCRNAACQVNTICKTSNRLVGNDSNNTIVFQRNINNCFEAMMSLNTQHAKAAADLQTEYQKKSERLKRDYERRLEEIKNKCFSNAGF